MKITGICGSPRENGNTETLLDRLLKGAAREGADTEKFVISRMEISDIREEEYENIDERGFSPVKDDMHRIYNSILAADAVVIASPVFFGSLSTQTKKMIDRFQCVWVSKFFHDREVYTRKIKGAFLSVEATERKDFFENARTIVKHFFATINAEYSGEVLVSGCDRKGSVGDRPGMLEQAEELGRRLAAG